ncbi:hypothetical protein LXL04_009975 [Taraxacum kok-saghyz]
MMMNRKVVGFMRSRSSSFDPPSSSGFDPPSSSSFRLGGDPVCRSRFRNPPMENLRWQFLKMKNLWYRLSLPSGDVVDVEPRSASPDFLLLSIRKL